MHYFFDEADSLFRRRISEERGWERTRTNQLLLEIDGLKTVRTSPFVILATNFPRDLDHAVLRRVPGRIYLGLPTKDERIRMFQLYLKDEMLDADVNFDFLERKSRRCSGSDIKNVCLMAALICNTFVDDEVPRRILKQTHFVAAFQRSPATTSDASLTGIMAFAREFDHAALDKMVQEKKRVDSATEEQDRVVDPEAPFFPTRQDPAQTPEPQKIPSALLDVVGLEIDRTKTPEGNDCNTSTSMEGDLEIPYQYIPLQPDSNQIRLLSFEPPVSSDTADNALLRCSLKKVDLDDWTHYYRAWLSMWGERLVKIFNFPDTDQARSAAWRRTGAAFSQDRERWEESARAFVEEVKSRSSCTNDAPFQDMETIPPRYEWGDYIALSYVWGNPGERRDIRLDGHQFSVTLNLYYALLHLRDSLEVRRMGLSVWIDAICINQDDLDERGAQVKKMNIIYSQALAVRAFLGHADPQVTAKLRALRTILETKSISKYPRDSILHNLDLNTIRKMGLDDSFWLGMEAISFSPYWRRVWTIQVTRLAPSLLYYYGQQAFSQSELLQFFNLMNDAMTSGIIEKVRSPNSLGSMDRSRNLYFDTVFSRLYFSFAFQQHSYDVTSQFGEMRLTRLVEIIQGSEATDLRDKIFGVLAILPKEIAVGIHPNYHSSISFSRVFRSFSKSFFQVLGNLNNLSGIDRTVTLLEGFPTWALSLAGKPNNDRASVRKYRPKESANLGMHMTEIGFSKDDTLMLCHGVVVDTTCLVGAARFEPLDLPVEFCYDRQQNLPDPTRFTREEWKLKLARTLFYDSHFLFKESWSIFDLPWLESDGLIKYEVAFYHDPNNDALDVYNKMNSYWPRLFVTSPIAQFFRNFMYGNEEVDIGGQSFKSYFASTEAICSEQAFFHKIGYELLKSTLAMRLCISRTGLLCMVPIFTKLNDKIVVLSECNVPMILRPRGETYEVIGPCYVEDLMNGEVAEGIKQGQYHVERICLC